MTTAAVNTAQPVLQARGLVKAFGRVVALNGADLELYPGEVLKTIDGMGIESAVVVLRGNELEFMTKE